MNCPKCGNETENGICSTCGKKIKDIYLKLYDEAQGKRNYESALLYIEDLKKLAEDEEELGYYEEIVNKIEFVKMNEKALGKKPAKVKDINKMGRKTKKGIIKAVFLYIILLIFTGVIGMGGFLLFRSHDYIIENKKLQNIMVLNLTTTLLNEKNKSDDSCNKIVKELRKHRNIKFTLCISGILLENMNLSESETLKIIREGIADGQFEVIGNSYSQNIIDATDDFSNKWQLERDREAKTNIFGIKTEGFFNPQEIWSLKTIKTISDNKYNYIFIEDEKLKEINSGYEPGKLGKLEKENINVFPFVKKSEILLDKLLKSSIISDKEQKELIKSFREIYEKQKGGVAAIFVNLNPKDKNSFQNLNKILNLLEQRVWISSVTAKESLKSIKPEYFVKNISEIKNENWYLASTNSNKLKYYKALQKSYAELIAGNIESENPVVKNLMKSAKEILLSAEYKFADSEYLAGESDFNKGIKNKSEENIKNIELIKEVLEAILNPQERIYSKDINGDGINELIVVNNRNFYVFDSSKGGKMTAWYDLMTGRDIISIYNPVENSGAINEIYTKINDNNKYNLSEKSMTAEIFGSKIIVLKNEEITKVLRFNESGVNVTYAGSDLIKSINVMAEIVPDFRNILKKGKGIIKSEVNQSVLRFFNQTTEIGVEVSVSNGINITSKPTYSGVEITTNIPDKKGTIDLKKIFITKQ